MRVCVHFLAQCSHIKKLNIFVTRNGKAFARLPVPPRDPASLPAKAQLFQWLNGEEVAALGSLDAAVAEMAQQLADAAGVPHASAQYTSAVQLNAGRHKEIIEQLQDCAFRALVCGHHAPPLRILSTAFLTWKEHGGPDPTCINPDCQYRKCGYACKGNYIEVLSDAYSSAAAAAAAPAVAHDASLHVPGHENSGALHAAVDVDMGEVTASEGSTSFLTATSSMGLDDTAGTSDPHHHDDAHHNSVVVLSHQPSAAGGGAQQSHQQQQPIEVIDCTGDSSSSESSSNGSSGSGTSDDGNDDDYEYSGSESEGSGTEYSDYAATESESESASDDADGGSSDEDGDGNSSGINDGGGLELSAAQAEVRPAAAVVATFGAGRSMHRQRGTVHKLAITFVHHKTERSSKYVIRFEFPEQLSQLLTKYHDYVRPAIPNATSHVQHALFVSRLGHRLNMSSVVTTFKHQQVTANVPWKEVPITFQHCRHIHAEHCVRGLLELDSADALEDDTHIMGNSRHELQRSYLRQYHSGATQAAIGRIQAWRRLMLSEGASQ